MIAISFHDLLRVKVMIIAYLSGSVSKGIGGVVQVFSVFYSRDTNMGSHVHLPVKAIKMGRSSKILSDLTAEIRA